MKSIADVLSRISTLPSEKLLNVCCEIAFSIYETVYPTQYPLRDKVLRYMRRSIDGFTQNARHETALIKVTYDYSGSNIYEDSDYAFVKFAEDLRQYNKSSADRDLDYVIQTVVDVISYRGRHWINEEAENESKIFEAIDKVLAKQLSPFELVMYNLNPDA